MRPDDPEVVGVEVSPASATLVVGEDLPLSASAEDAMGNTVNDLEVTWATGDEDVVVIGQDGTVTAVAPGTTDVTATISDVTGSATVHVRAREVETLEISPPQSALSMGSTTRLNAVARGEGGDEVAVNISWASRDSSVATVDATGLVRGEGEGATWIVASTESIRDSAEVTVHASTAEVYFEEGFEDGDLASRGWFDNTSLTITNEESRSGQSALEIRFLEGGTLPTFGGASRIEFEETDRVYLSYWVKYSANWVGSGRSYHPHEFQFLTTADDPFVGPAFTHLTTYVEHNYQDGIVPVFGTQDAANIDLDRVGEDLTGTTEDRATAGCNGDGDAYSTSCFPIGSTYRNGKFLGGDEPVLTPGPGASSQNEWHFVEAYFELNSIVNGVGQADGSARYWLDGELILDFPNLLFRTGSHPDMAFRVLVIGPYIGDGSSVEQITWIDDVRVANGRP